MATSAALNHTQERKASTSNGGMMLLLSLLVGAATLWMLIGLIADENALNGIGTIVGSLAFVLMLCGFYTLQPNEGAAITLFGNYKGTDRTPGLRWMLPWYSRKKVSLRVRNVTGEKLKVNDKRGNPIEIAAVVVWRVTDTAQALFDVDSYQTFVDIQIETAVREIASHFAYDHAEHEEPTLRGDAEQVSTLLRQKLQERVAVAGVVIDETKLSHLAYAPEIAGAMLQRQQAEAIIDARKRIVDGAVGMVQMALEMLRDNNVLELDEERKAQMVSNLLVVLCSERGTQPVLNAGTLYG